MLEQHKVNYVKNIKFQEIIHRLVNKFKTKGTVETEHLGGRLVKRTPHTGHKIIRYVKIKHGDGNRLMVYRWFLGFSELEQSIA